MEIKVVKDKESVNILVTTRPSTLILLSCYLSPSISRPIKRLSRPADRRTGQDTENQEDTISGHQAQPHD